MATQQEQPCFTVGVFQDLQWAERGLAALAEHGFAAGELSLVAQSSPDVEALVEKTFGIGTEQAALDIPRLGAAMAHGPLIEALQGVDGGLGANGVAATMCRAGFQAHDGFIFETLTSRGGILIAIEGEPRAADALALLHAYGGGNAAIGAWRGRV